MLRSNLHTHTSFCDGAAAPVEYINNALSLGFTALGFSGHSHTPFDSEYCLPANYAKYQEEILRLKEQFEDKIYIALGLERDIHSVVDKFEYDYVIGSTHYILKNGKYISVDRSNEYFVNVIKEIYGGNALNFAKDYYATQADVIKKTKGNIVGHFDLIRKYNYNNKYFDENNREYINAALEALEAVCEDADIFEINSGAAARGANPVPYPAPFLLRCLKEKGKYIIISSDAHKPECLNAGFDVALQMAKDAGFKSVLELCEKGFKETAI